MSKKNKYLKKLHKKNYETKGKKNKKTKFVKDETPKYKKFKKAKETLSKKERKFLKKQINKPIKVDKDFIELRDKCNHSCDRITVEEFCAKNVAFNAYTPMLSNLVNVFGEENVSICKNCYEALVDASCIPTVEDVAKCATILYAACNFMKQTTANKGEIKSLTKLQENLGKFSDVMPLLEKAIKRAEVATASEAKAEPNLAELNKNFIG